MPEDRVEPSEWEEEEELTSEDEALRTVSKRSEEQYDQATDYKSLISKLNYIQINKSSIY